ncbi:MAG: hypothetical protein Q9159_006263 [Coniocarpon cinnabarinum]
MPEDEDKEKAEKVAAAKKKVRRIWSKTATAQYEQMKKDKAKKGTKKKGEKTSKAGDTSAETDEAKVDDAGAEAATEAEEKEEVKTDDKDSSAAQQSRERSKSFRQASDAVSEEAKKAHEKNVVRIEELEKENAQLRENLRSSQSAPPGDDASSQAQKIDRLKKELEASRRQTKPKSNSSDLAAQLATRTTALESLELELSTLRHTLDTTKQSLADAEARAKAAEEASKSADARLDDLKRSLEATSTAEKVETTPEDPATKIALLSSDLSSAQSALSQSTTRIAALEAKTATLQKLHTDAETQHASQTRSRIAELEHARTEIATLRKRLSSTTNENVRLRSSSQSEPAANGDADDEGVDELEDEARGKLEERVRALETENFELRRGVWKARRTELQGEMADHPSSPGGAFDDVDLSTPHPAMSRSLSAQGQSMGQAFGNFVNAFNKQIGEIAGGTGPSAAPQRYRGLSAGRPSLDDDDFDESAFAAASQAEDDARRAEEMARLERVREVKRGLVEWKGWRVDLVDLRGGPMLGVEDDVGSTSEHMIMQTVVVIGLDTNISHTAPDSLHYLVIESADPESGHHFLRLQAETATQQSLVSSAERVRGRLTLNTDQVQFQGSIRALSVRPEDPSDASWRVRQVETVDKCSHSTRKDILTALKRGGRFMMSDLVPPVGDVQVGSSLPHEPGEKDALHEEDHTSEIHASAPNTAGDSPRLAHKFKRDTVIETPATNSRTMTANIIDEQESPASPSNAKSHNADQQAGDPATSNTMLTQDLDTLEYPIQPPDTDIEQALAQSMVLPSKPAETSSPQPNSNDSYYGTAREASALQYNEKHDEEQNVKQEDAGEESPINQLMTADKIRINASPGSAMQNAHNPTNEPDHDDQENVLPKSSSLKRGRLSEDPASPISKPKTKRIESAEAEHEETTPTSPKPKRGRPRKSAQGSVGTVNTPISTPPNRSLRARLSKSASESGVKIPHPTSLSSGNKATGPDSARKVNDYDDPHSSRRSSRRASHVSPTIPKLPTNHIRVLLSNTTLAERGPMLDKFKKLGSSISQSQSPDAFDVLVIGAGEIKKTAKLLTAVATAKPVVYDSWVTDSVKASRVLALDKYFPANQSQWGYNPSKIFPRSDLLAGKTVHVTPALKRQWGEAMFREFDILARAIGVDAMLSKTTRGLRDDANTLVLGLEKDDGDCAALLDRGQTCYSRDLLVFSVLRGRLDLESDEFRVLPATSQDQGRKKAKANGEANDGTPAPKRGRPRKSI